MSYKTHAEEQKHLAKLAAQTRNRCVGAYFSTIKGVFVRAWLSDYGRTKLARRLAHKRERKGAPRIPNIKDCIV